MKPIKAINIIRPDKSIVPIINNIMVSGNQITVTDLTNGIRLNNVGISGSFLIDAKLASRTILKWSDIEVIDGFPKVQFKRGNASCTFPVEMVDDFVKLPFDEDLRALGTITTNDLKKIAKALAFIGKEELRYSMLHVALTGGEIAATDAHSLFWTKSDFAHNEPLLLTKKTCQLLALFPDQEFTVKRSASHWRLECSEASIIQRHVDEKYPDYRSILPAKTLTTLSVKKSVLKPELTEALLFADSSTSQIVLSLNGKCDLTAEDIMWGSEYASQIEATKSGQDIRIGFNGKFLLKALTSVDGDDVEISFQEANRAAVVNGHTLVMPVALPTFN